jgi:hypothetical protein
VSCPDPRDSVRHVAHVLAGGPSRLGRCKGVGAGLRTGDLVNYGIPGREQIGRIDRPEGRHGNPGWRIIPVSAVSDSYATVWYPRHRVRPWNPARWAYSQQDSTWSLQPPVLAVPR